MKVLAFFKETIATWEGGLSRDPGDRGNWYAVPGGPRALVGSNHGVTGATLARWRGRPVTAADVAALTLNEAAAIGERLFWREPGFDRLGWDATLASVVDFGWGAGPGTAIRLLQRLAGAEPDGAIGPATVDASRRWRAVGPEGAARAWGETRSGYYRRLAAARPADARFLAGWTRRAASFLPGTLWWQRFAARPEATLTEGCASATRPPTTTRLVSRLE